MPTYIRPARVDIKEGGGGVLVLAAAALAAGALVVFILANLALLAVATAVFVAVIGGFAVWTRKFRRLPQPVKRKAIKHTLIPGRALPVPPKAIEAPRAVTGQAVTPAAVPVRQARR